MKLYLLYSSIIISILSCSKTTPLEIALGSNSSAIQKVMNDFEKYEIQIIYTQIQRDKNNAIHFEDFKFNVNDSIYFYPASTVKFPVALLALQKLKSLQEQGININRKTKFTTKNDTLYTTLEREIIKIFAISDNQAYNRLFEFLGQEFINQNLQSKNIAGRISHRLSALHSHNPKTQAISFKENVKDSIFVYQQKSIVSSVPPKLSIQKQFKGKAYIYRDTLIPGPKDFSEKNYIPLSSLHETMKRLQFPQKYSKSQRFNITSKDYAFVLKAMSILPYEAGYDRKKYYDSYGKFFMFGDTKNNIPGHVEIYNKVGYAYGYLTDCAYFKDRKNNIEFILSATISVNENEIYNDNNYQYKTIGIPFLAALGREIYAIEKARKE